MSQERCCVIYILQSPGKMRKLGCRNKPYLKTRGSRKWMAVAFCKKHAEAHLSPTQLKRSSILTTQCENSERKSRG